MNRMTLDYALKEGFVDLQLSEVNPATGGQRFAWDVMLCPANPFRVDPQGNAVLNRYTGDFKVIDYEMLNTYGVKKENVVPGYENKAANALSALFPSEPDDSFKKGFDDGAWQGGDEPGCDFSP